MLSYSTINSEVTHVKAYLLLILILLCGCTTPQLHSDTRHITRHRCTNLVKSTAVLAKQPTVIWEKVRSAKTHKLQEALNQTSDPNAKGWLTLALISKKYSINSQELSQQLLQWRKEYPNHAANALLPNDATLTALQNAPAPRNIALLLPLDGSLGAQGSTIRDGFLNAYYEAGKKSQQTVSFINTSKTTNMSALYQQAISQGADTIIGPLTKEQVALLLKQGSFSTQPLLKLHGH